MTLSELLKSFDAFLREHRSKSTRHSYTCRVRAYLRTINGDHEFTTQHVRAYLTRLADDHRPRTVAIHLASVRAFGDYAVSQGVLQRNPAADVRSPRLDAPRRETATNSQITALLDATDLIRHPYRRALARAVISIVAYSGLRRSEVLALRVSDVDLADECLYVRHGKGDKARTVRPGAHCIADLRAYLALRPESTCPRLLLRRQNTPLADQGLRILLRDVAHIAGLADCRGILPHGMRHACATRLLRNGADIADIKEFLGHADISTTAVYLHSPTDRMREVARLTAIPNPPGAPTPPEPAPQPPLRLVRYEEA